MSNTLIHPVRLTAKEQREIIKKLWNLFRCDGTHDDIREYAAMAEALMAEYGIRWEKFENVGIPQRYDGDVKEWFYDEINTVAMADNFCDFFATATAAMDFSRSHNPFR